MNKKTVLAAFATLLASTLCSLGSSEAGMVKVVNTTSGTDPSKALLKEYQETAPHLLRDYTVTVDNQGKVTVTSSTPTGFL